MDASRLPLGRLSAKTASIRPSRVAKPAVPNENIRVFLITMGSWGNSNRATYEDSPLLGEE
ncbi:hypothetical protein B9Q03_12165 [Candidatus Marsarchaeota G2 archaeon OSP_D]|uniref:Uncharacterized protein n=1 Tax=Candidatus Marsarchaeota G2 archaeon OSP_D TaxID=1978157 RepID=A0A2R6AH43_9ARCH|nr:MAG: hypothetical protein B9Q03_12165 [Candidatus Marsarchaeota G2 archaeon OSP_D]